MALAQLAAERITTRIAFRVPPVVPTAFYASGPQLHLGKHTKAAFLTNRRNNQDESIQSKNVMKPDGFNDVLIRCEGQRVKLVVNGEIIYDDKLDMPAAGRIGFTSGGQGRVEIRDIRFTDLSKPATGAWRPLLNGKDFSGWNVSTPAKAEIVTEAGRQAIRIKPVYDLVLKDSYRDFHLKADFLTLAPGTAAGIAYRSGKDIFSFNLGAGGLLNALGNCEARPGEIKGGRVVATDRPFAHGLPALPGLLKPVGEWNTLEIVVTGDTAVHVLNGKVVCVGADLRVSGVPSAEGAIRLYCSGGEGVVFSNVLIREVAALPEEFGGPKATADPDRKAAEAIRSHVGYVRLRIKSSGQVANIPLGEPLPAVPFWLMGVGFKDQKLAADFASRTLFPTITGLTKFGEIHDPNFMLVLSAADLDQLAACVPPAEIRVLSGVVLTPQGSDALKRFTKIDTLNMLGDDVTDDSLLRLGELPALRRLYTTRLGNSGKVTPEGLAAFEQLPLDVLALLDSRKLEAKHFRSIAKMPKLKLLDLSITSHGNDVLAELAASPSLEHITLPSLAVTDAGLEHLHKLKTLRFLGVKGAKVTEAGVKTLGAALPLCKIVWDGPTIEPDPKAAAEREQKAARAAALWFLDKNAKVRINGTLVTSRDDLPAGPFKLTAVEVTDGAKPPTDADIDQLVDCPDVVKFEFWHAKITDRGVETLVGFLQATASGPERMKFLVIESAGVTDAGVKLIGRCTGLKHLGLKATRVTDAGLLSLHGLTELEFIHLGSTKVSADGVNKLAAALPKCKIEWDSGIIEPTKVSK